MLPDLHLQTRPEEGRGGQLEVELQIFSGRAHGQMPETGFSANPQDPLTQAGFLASHIPQVFLAKEAHRKSTGPHFSE